MGGSTRAAGHGWSCRRRKHRVAVRKPRRHGQHGLTAYPGATDRRRARMFTGIVEDLGEVEAIEHAGDSARIFIRSATVTVDARPGDSIAVNGVCLTVTGFIDGRLGADPGTEGTASPHPRGFSADVM